MVFQKVLYLLEHKLNLRVLWKDRAWVETKEVM